MQLSKKNLYFCNINCIFMQKEVLSGLNLDNGEPIYTQEYIQSLRDTDKKHPDKLKIIAQRGGQEDMLSIDAI